LNRRSFALFLLIATALVLFGAPEFAACGQQASLPNTPEAAPGARVVLTIGDEKMTAAQIDQFIQALPPQYKVFYGGPGKRYLPQYIIAMKVLSAEAIRLKLAEQPEVVEAIEIAREGVLSVAAREHYMQDIKVSDQELQELYQKDKTESEEVRIRHILIATENAPLKPEALGHPALPEPQARQKLEDIRQRILAGADFAQMAKQYSEDPETAASGGDMGIVQGDKFVPPVVHAAHALEPGQVSNILETPAGLEIIQVENKRTKPFEEVRPALETQLRESKATEIVQHLIDKYPMVVDQEFFAGPNSTPKQNPPSPATH
jgi:parvulin-like peptidyl-prolyl isomerase